MILQIETATSVCSAALSDKGHTVSTKELNEPNVHASQLTLLVDALMQDAGLRFSDLDAVAVSMGPGSYTGLRIGVSAAKGFCYAADLPLIAVPTLQAMAWGFRNSKSMILAEKALLVPMVDARRMEVYMGVFDQELEVVVDTSAEIIDEQSFFHYGNDIPVVLFGNGADKLMGVFEGNKQVDVQSGFLNSASHMSCLAFRKLEQGQLEDVAYFEPYYLKDFIPTTPRKAN